MPADRKPSTKRAAAQQRIAEKRAAEAAARAAEARRRKVITGGAVAAVLVVIAVIVVIVVQTQRTSTSADAAVPGNTGNGTGGTGFVVGSADAPVTIDIYEDYQCPACQQFEAMSGDTIEQLVDAGTVKVVYHPIAILDRYSTDQYSTRSLNAAAVVADAAGVDAFHSFSKALYAEQPREGGPGLTDDRLVELAADAGATGESVEAGIRDLRFEDWTKTATDAASKAGVTGTPTILVDGEQLENYSPDTITAAVEAAQS